MCTVDIILQELQAVVQMLHKMAFQLTGKVVDLHLVDNNVKGYLCN